MCSKCSCISDDTLFLIIAALVLLWYFSGRTHAAPMSDCLCNSANGTMNSGY